MASASESIRPGATPAELDELRRKIAPCSLPADLAVLLAWEAGIAFDASAELVRPIDVAALKGMMDGHVAAGRFDDYRPGEWWNAGWLPFTLDPNGAAMLVLDTVGCFGGEPGQILAWDWHPERPIVAVSLAAWCAAWAEGLERGILVASRNTIRPESCNEGRWERSVAGSSRRCRHAGPRGSVSAPERQQGKRRGRSGFHCDPNSNSSRSLAHRKRRKHTVKGAKLAVAGRVAVAVEAATSFDATEASGKDNGPPDDRQAVVCGASSSGGFRRDCVTLGPEDLKTTACSGGAP